ncbi:Cyclohex-1-ene-1-carbonyl-CoA dehydrogenase [Methylobacterium brachiatum]|uniref:acyl-CoA dehydrogenase family protein n=1 Tax=Methylobacterium sp. J-048 TaxID=2836635 RepID=UPI00137CA16C|nr:acyl-CoA dehydrogenase family protein [Methylobacterium sp. J-048]MCJ2056908.1 acyl-CoA/acyl-ACP dehydrogenase [Methylobacterium sp. J-048]CAA2158874.1 Cyclohex-1-ene-1-carbonyl-CoA dehydrogenase [Methylobacterium brachiatum]
MNTTNHAQDGAADEVADIVLDQFERLLAQHLSPQVLAACDGAVDDAAWPADLWRALNDSGLPLALVPEAADGIGLEARTAALLIRRCGQAALPLPLPETIAGAALWAAAGGGAPEGALTLVPAGSPVRITRRADGFVLDGRAAQVPWGGSVAALLVDAIDAAGVRHLVRITAPGTVRDTRHNLAGEPRDALDLTGCTAAIDEVRTAPDWAAEVGVGSVEAAGAWVRAQQLVGAMETCLASALDHARERQQFGRPLAKFQAIQHMLAEAAGHVAAATASADLAAACWGDARFVLATAIAKARCGEAAGHVAAICHQIHGAMGFTQEHPLHRATRRLWSWRDEFGSDALWQERIGRAVCAGGGTALWPMLVRLRAGAG